METNSELKSRRKSSQLSIFSNAATSNGSVAEKDIESALPEEDEEDEKAKPSKIVSSTFTLIAISLMIMVSLLFVKYFDNYVPTPLMLDDLMENPDRFIEERARQDLHDMTQVGVRIAGSDETDVITVNNFIDKLQKIKDSSASSAYSLEFEAQRPKGAFYMEGSDYTATYSQIANVVAKLEPSAVHLRTNNSFLINCHFDTKPGSPGATDNMISCVTMLEVIRVLVAAEHPKFQNTLLFLFNGAEELGLHGAHGFVKGNDSSTGLIGHRWIHSNPLKAFMNLEGAGGGGREILFQTGPGDSWIFTGYQKSAEHPYGTVIAEEAFQMDLIPSDTDFRIFRDFGEIPGLDMAFIKNGWVYHTKWDKLKEIPGGSIQNMGDNALAIVKYFSDFDFDNNGERSDTNMVFFDVLGFFMVSYSEVIAIVINVLTALATLAAISYEVWKNMMMPWKERAKILGLAVLGNLVATGVAVLIGVLVALFLNGCGYPKPFYSYPFLSVIIFGVPAMIGQVIIYAYATKGVVAHAWLGTKLVQAVLLFITTFITRAVYPITYNLIFSVIAWFAGKYLLRGWPRSIFLFYLIVGELIPFILSSYLVVTLIDVFVPILGRSGSETNANLYFGIVISAVVSIFFTNLATLCAGFDKKLLIFSFFVSFFIINPLLVFGFVGKIPFQEKTPMRLNIVDLDRTWYERDLTTVKLSNHGYWFWTLDPDTGKFLDTFAETVEEMSRVERVSVNSEDCDYLNCAQAFWWPTTNAIKETYFVPKPTGGLSHLRDQVKMTVDIIENSQGKELKFEFLGPTQLSVIICPTNDYQLVSWTLTEEIPESAMKWKGRNTYYVYQDRGNEGDSMAFSVQLNGSSPPDSEIMEVQVVGYFLYGENQKTEEFNDFAERFPHWTDTMIWSAVLKQFTIT